MATTTYAGSQSLQEPAGQPSERPARSITVVTASLANNHLAFG
jgi:hypothetical protein